MTLPQFLDMAKASNVSGILIEVEVISIQFVRRYCCFFQFVISGELIKHSCAGCTHAACFISRQERARRGGRGDQRTNQVRLRQGDEAAGVHPVRRLVGALGVQEVHDVQAGAQHRDPVQRRLQAVSG